MSENEEGKKITKEKKATEQKSVGTKMFIKEKRNSTPMFIMAVITAIIAGAIGSVLTYTLLTKTKNNNSTNTSNSNNTTSIKIEATDSPVVAIAKKAGPSIVGIKINAMSQTMFGSLQESSEEGSGIIYSQDGYIVTNYHVIESAIKDSSAKISVTLADSDETIEALVGYDETTDLAVIKVEKAGLTAAEFGKSSELQVGDIAVAIGNPLGQELAGSVTVGYISALNRKITTSGRTYKLIQTDAAINPGNSGGALVNSQGQVIGINTVKIGSSLSGASVEGLGFAIPSDDAVDIINKLIKDKKIVRPYIGVSGINVDETTAKMNNLPQGVYVAQVVTNSPASKAGLQKGDVITGIEGKDITTMEELNEIKNTKNVGDKITLKVHRQNKDMDVQVTLESDDTTQASN